MLESSTITIPTAQFELSNATAPMPILKSRTEMSESASTCHSNTSQHSNVISTAQNDEELRVIVSAVWGNNMNALYKLELRDRPYLTTVRKKIIDSLQIMINDLGMQHLTKLENDKGRVSFWDINATIYVAAVTSQTILNDLRIAKPVAERRVKLVWVRQLEHRIDSLRRKISQISVVLQCMEAGNLLPIKCT